MENYEREYFLSRIIAGYTRFKKQDICLKIKHPTLDITYEGNEIYKEVYSNSLEEGIMTSDDALNLLYDTKQWDDEKEHNFTKKIPEDIEKFQEGLYLFAYKQREVERLRKYLAAARKEQDRLSLIRTKYDAMTCSGLAAFARYNFLVENSVFNYDNTKYSFDKIGLMDITSYSMTNMIQSEIIRELSRSLPWVNQWGSCKSNGSIFPVSGVELTTSQNLLIMWSRMYDSIYESTESPEQFIIDDDDMLDGWLIVQRKKSKERKAKSAAESFTSNSKIRNAQEVFLVAENAEEAKRIYDMNSNRGNSIVRQRLNKIRSQGKVNHAEFSDVQLERTVKMTEAYQKNIKGQG